MPQPSYPILLDVGDRLCVIIGGGAVAGRKARGLIAAGAYRVRMIAPAFATEVPQGVQQLHERYRPEHLEDAGIVFAATDVPDVNGTVVRDCRARGILVSRADSDDEFPGDFVSAAQFAKGPVMVAVSAGSAALSVTIRDELAAQWDDRWTVLAEAMVKLRPEIKRQWDESTRKKIFHDLATAEALRIVSSGGIEGLKQWIAARYREKVGAAE
jgi:siroheme synthase-like protein